MARRFFATRSRRFNFAHLVSPEENFAFECVVSPFLQATDSSALSREEAVAFFAQEWRARAMELGEVEGWTSAKADAVAACRTCWSGVRTSDPVCRYSWCPWCRARRIASALRVVGYSDADLRGRLRHRREIVSHRIESSALDGESFDALVGRIRCVRDYCSRLVDGKRQFGSISFLNISPVFRDNLSSVDFTGTTLFLVREGDDRPDPFFDRPVLRGSCSISDVSVVSAIVRAGYGFSPSMVLAPVESLSLCLKASTGIRTISSGGVFRFKE
jgi:hypothetical protein